MRSEAGTNSAPPVVVTRATNAEMAVFAGPSFHDGSGSTAAAGAISPDSALSRLGAGERPSQPTASRMPTHTAKSAGARIESGLRFRRLGKRPSAIDDGFTRPVQAHRHVPAFHDRQQVRRLRVAAAELDSVRAVFRLLCRHVVERVRVALVLLEKSSRVVDGHGPESV